MNTFPPKKPKYMSDSLHIHAQDIPGHNHIHVYLYSIQYIHTFIVIHFVQRKKREKQGRIIQQSCIRPWKNKEKDTITDLVKAYGWAEMWAFSPRYYLHCLFAQPSRAFLWGRRLLCALLTESEVSSRLPTLVCAFGCLGNQKRLLYALNQARNLGVAWVCMHVTTHQAWWMYWIPFSFAKVEAQVRDELWKRAVQWICITKLNVSSLVQ